MPEELPPLLPEELLPPLLPEVLVGLAACVVGLVVGEAACVAVVLVVCCVDVVLVVGCEPSMRGVRIGARGFNIGSRMGMEGIGKGRLMSARSSSSPTRLCRCCMVARAAAACMFRFGALLLLQ